MVHCYGVSGPLLQAIWFLYNCCKSLVRIASNNLDYFLVGFERCSLSLIVFLIFVDRISRHSQVAEGFHLCSHRVLFRGKREGDRWIGTVAADMRPLYQSIVQKRVL